LTADDRIHTRHLNNFQYIPIILSKLSEIWAPPAERKQRPNLVLDHDLVTIIRPSSSLSVDYSQNLWVSS
jgi:hypothetical protein